MMKHVIRIEADWLRIPLLCLCFPVAYAHYAVTTVLKSEEERGSLRRPELWLFPVSLFWAAWDGLFVP